MILTVNDSGGRRMSKFTNENHPRRLFTWNNQLKFAPRAGNNDDGVYFSMMCHILYCQQSSHLCYDKITHWIIPLSGVVLLLGARPHGANRHFCFAVVTRSIITSWIPSEFFFLFAFKSFTKVIVFQCVMVKKEPFFHLCSNNIEVKKAFVLSSQYFAGKYHIRC